MLIDLYRYWYVVVLICLGHLGQSWIIIVLGNVYDCVPLMVLYI